MKQICVLFGNCLVGDAFLTMWRHCLPEPDTHKMALVIPYNRGVPETFRDVMGLQIDDIQVHPDVNSHHAFGSFEEYTTWLERFAPHDPDMEYRPYIPTHDLTLIPGVHRWEPHGYLTAQADSIHNWKRIPAMREIQYPLPMKSIGLSGEWFLDDREVPPILGVPPSALLNIDKPKPGPGPTPQCKPGEKQLSERTQAIIDWPLPEVARLLLGANLHVGISSGITCLAILLGVPTILCDFMPPDWSNPPPTTIILTKPTADELQAAITTMLTRFPG